jgi:hypothetical protein
MKKTVLYTMLLSVFAGAVTVFGVILCISLSQNSGAADKSGWDMYLMLPKPASVIIAIVLLILDALCVFMAVTLTVSYVKSSKAVNDADKKSDKPRFCRLAEIDKNGPGRDDDAAFNDRVGLDEFCRGFRNFAASEMKLYYGEEVIRSFIAGLSCTHLIILEGISGTGKTSLPFAFGRYVGRGASVTPVQPSWKDRSDLLGYYNEFTDSYTETELLCDLYKANLTDDIYTVVLDEMNIARVEYYFAEFLSLLELPEGTSRRVRVTADSRQSDPDKFINGTLELPSNVWFVGTANNDDSTLAVSDKVYDRAFVIELNSRSEKFDAPETGRSRISATRLKDLFKTARTSYPVQQKTRAGIAELDDYLLRHVGLTFGNRVMRQAESFIPVYIACGGAENDAVDVLLRNKILYKMDSLNPVICRAECDGIIKTVERIFGEGELYRSVSYLKKFRSDGI